MKNCLKQPCESETAVKTPTKNRITEGKLDAINYMKWSRPAGNEKLINQIRFNNLE